MHAGEFCRSLWGNVPQNPGTVILRLYVLLVPVEPHFAALQFQFP